MAKNSAALVAKIIGKMEKSESGEKLKMLKLPAYYK
jgi:hypothetical protein